MKYITLLMLLFVVGCAGNKVEPRTVWINGYPIKENCLFADEQWNRILPAIGSPNINSHTVHTSSGSYATTRIGDQSYICNRSQLEADAKRK